MTEFWQNVIALACVCTAAASIAWRVRKLFARQPRGGCGACANCPSKSVGELDQSQPLIQLGTGSRAG